MLHFLKEQLRGVSSLAAKQSGVVLIGDMFAKTITFAISVIVMAFSTPEEYIIFGLFLTVMAIAVQFSDFGVNLSFVRFYSLYVGQHDNRAYSHFHLALRIKIVAFVLSSIGLYLLSDIIGNLLGYPELSYSLHILAFGLLGLGLFEFFQAVYQARQEFKKLTILRGSEAALKIAIIGWFVFNATLTLPDVYLAYIIAPASICVIVFVTSRKFHVKVRYSIEKVGGELFAFGKWIALSMMATMIMQHLDVLMIAPLMDDMPGQSGLYYAGKKFVTPIQVLTTSLVTVFYPKAMALSSVEEMKHYVLRTLRISVPLSVALVGYLAALYFIIPAVLPEYSDALPVILVLFVGWIWTLIGNPITILMLSINRANIATRISFAQLLLMIASHYFFITKMGGLGAALSNIIVWFAAGILSFWYIFRHRSAIVQVQEAAVG